MRYEGDGIMASLLAMKNVLKLKQGGTLNTEDILATKNINVDSYFSHRIVVKDCFTSVKNSNHDIMFDEFKNLFKDDSTTVSMYLNLPAFNMKKEVSKTTKINRCSAIADSLGLVHELLHNTEIAQYIDSDEAGKMYEKCKKGHQNIQKGSSFGRSQRRRSVKRKTTKRAKKSSKKTSKRVSKVKKSTKKRSVR